MRQNYDVTVIGAGPGGSAAAQVVAQGNWRVLLLERDEYPGARNVCGGGLEPQDVEIVGVDDRLVQKVIHRREHIFPWGMVVRQREHITVLRRELDRALAGRAVEAGATLLVRTKAQDVQVDAPGRVRVRAVNLDTGQTLEVSSRLVIFADGPRSLAHRLNLGIPLGPMDMAVALRYELEWPDNPLDHYEVHFGAHISPWGYAWIFPKRHVLNVGLWCLPWRGYVGPRIEVRLRRFIDGHPLLRGRQIVHRRGSLIPMRSARQLFAPSLLIVGDAAGLVNALTGAGIGHAVLSGRLAGQVAVQALEEKDFSASFLARYQREWQATEHHRRIVRQERLTHLLCPLSRLDGNLYAKLMQVLVLGASLRPVHKLRLLGYPLISPPPMLTEPKAVR